MRKKVKKHLVLAAFLTSVSLPVLSGGIPTIDLAAIAEALVQTTNQLTMIANMKTQITHMIATKEAMTGTRFVWSSVLNGTDEKNMRRVLPPEWQDIGSKIVSMNVYQKRVKDSYDATKLKLYEYGTAQGVMPSQKTGSPTQQLYDEARESSAKHNAAVRSSYQMVSDRMAKIEVLIDKVGTTNDIKDSADLNNRIQAENSLLMLDMTKLQAAHYTALAQKDARELQEDTLHRQFARGGDISIKGKY